MSKPSQSRELKPKEEEGKPASKLSLDSNMMLVANTIIIIIFLAIFTIINHSINKSLIEKEVSKLQTTEEATATEETDANVDEKGILLDLGDFILNLADATPRRYLKVNVAIELSRTQEELAAATAEEPAKASGGGHGGGHGAAAPADPMAAVVAEMDQYKPAIRDAVISVLSSKTADELSSTTGKEIAKEEIQDLVGSVFNGNREVLRVSFGQFIIQ